MHRLRRHVAVVAALGSVLSSDQAIHESLHILPADVGVLLAGLPQGVCCAPEASPGIFVDLLDEELPCSNHLWCVSVMRSPGRMAAWFSPNGRTISLAWAKESKQLGTIVAFAAEVCLDQGACPLFCAGSRVYLHCKCELFRIFSLLLHKRLSRTPRTSIACKHAGLEQL